MFDKINLEALDRSDVETAAAFVQSVATVAHIVFGADVSKSEMQDTLYVIAHSLDVAGAILYACADGTPLVKPLAGQAPSQKEVA